MEEMGIDATEKRELKDWEADQSLFAPPQPQKLLRGWDRAPVSAHASRLRKTSVWKRPENRPAIKHYDENEAQIELEREGLGARKKLRMTSAKENIGLAAWDKPKNANEALNGSFKAPERRKLNLDTPGSPVNLEFVPVKQEDSVSFGMANCLPRKRNNNRAVILPKKSLRRSTLKVLKDEPSPAIKPERTTVRPRKSLRQGGKRAFLGTSEQSSGGKDPIIKMETDPDGSIDPSRSSPNNLINLVTTPFRRRSQQSTRSTPKSMVLYTDRVSRSASRGTLTPAARKSAIDALLLSDGEAPPTLEKIRNFDIEPNSDKSDESCIVAAATAGKLPFEETGCISSTLVALAAFPAADKQSSPSKQKKLGEDYTMPQAAYQLQIVDIGAESSYKSRTHVGQSELRRQDYAHCKKLITFTSDTHGHILATNTNGADVSLESSIQPDPEEVKESRKVSNEQESSEFRAREEAIEIDFGSTTNPLTSQPPSSENDGSQEVDIKVTSEEHIEVTDANVISEDTYPLVPLEMADLDISGPTFGCILAKESGQAHPQTGAAGEPFSFDDREGRPGEHNSPSQQLRLELSQSPSKWQLEFVAPEDTSTSIGSFGVEFRQDYLLPRADIPRSRCDSSEDHEETSYLSSFISRVKESKKASSGPNRKRSLPPHSPLKIPLESTGLEEQPSSPIASGAPLRFPSTSLPSSVDPSDIASVFASPFKRRKPSAVLRAEDPGQTPRRSGRTRLPVKSGIPLARPSLVPIKTLGCQTESEVSVLIQRNTEKELAIQTRVNTKRNKGSAVLPQAHTVCKFGTDGMDTVEALPGQTSSSPELTKNGAKLNETLRQKTLGEYKSKRKGRGLSLRWANDLVEIREFGRGADMTTSIIAVPKVELAVTTGSKAVEKKVAEVTPVFKQDTEAIKKQIQRASRIAKPQSANVTAGPGASVAGKRVARGAR